MEYCNGGTSMGINLWDCEPLRYPCMLSAFSSLKHKVGGDTMLDTLISNHCVQEAIENAKKLIVKKSIELNCGDHFKQSIEWVEKNRPSYIFRALGEMDGELWSRSQAKIEWESKSHLLNFFWSIKPSNNRVPDATNKMIHYLVKRLDELDIENQSMKERIAVLEQIIVCRKQKCE